MGVRAGPPSHQLTHIRRQLIRTAEDAREGLCPPTSDPNFATPSLCSTPSMPHYLYHQQHHDYLRAVSIRCGGTARSPPRPHTHRLYSARIFGGATTTRLSTSIPAEPSVRSTPHHARTITASCTHKWWRGPGRREHTSRTSIRSHAVH